jgi:DNA repair ATPase RecN
VAKHHQLALEAARQLHTQRVHYAQELGQFITDSMHMLSMPHGVFDIDVALMSIPSRLKAQIVLSSASPPTPVSRYRLFLKSLRR